MSIQASTSDRILRAIREIKVQFGDDVSVISKGKSERKYGYNADVGTTIETVWQVGGDETFPAGNNIDIVTSTAAGDTQDVLIEGFTLSGSALTFVSQTATLSGTDNVVLTTPLYRATRLINEGATDFAGVVTVEDNTTSTHISVPIGVTNQSLKCATAVADGEYWILTQIAFGVSRTLTRSVDFSLEIREFGKTFRNRLTFPASNDSGMQIFEPDPCIIVRPNSDIRMRAVSSGITTGVFAFLGGPLADVV